MIPLGEKIHQRLLAHAGLILYCLFPIALLSGCVGEKQGLLYDTFKLAFTNPHSAIDNIALDPRYRYLKVEANGQPALLVLGYIDKKQNTASDIWYSAYKEVVEIKDGRLANTEGMEVNWTQVTSIDAPSLIEALSSTDGVKNKRNPKFRYSRMRTVMPGYHVNIRETVIMEALNETPSDAPKILQDANSNADIRWVQETVLVPPASQNPSIKPLRAIYAVNIKSGETIYGKQYLNENFYVSWLRWPYPRNLPIQPEVTSK